MKKDITINDIALAAGVSKTTVSRVLNGSTGVNEETRNKVLEVIEAKNFTPSALARNLSKQKSDSIGVIIPAVDNVFFGKILRTVIDILDRYNLNIVCCNSDNDRIKEKKALEMLKENRVKGLLYTPAEDYSSPEQKMEIEKLLQDLNAPVVIVDREIEDLEYDRVHFDDEEGIYNATTELIKAGHKKIGIINASLDRYLPRVRQKGYVSAMNDANIPINQDYIFICEGDYSQDKGYALANKLLAMEDRPTAVITCNNTTSLGFLKALQERGEKIAKDIDLIGLDQIEALNIIGMNFNFIERNEKKIGEHAIKLLLDRIENPKKPIRDVILDTYVIMRELKGVSSDSQ